MKLRNGCRVCPRNSSEGGSKSRASLAVAQGRLLGAFAIEDEIRPESSEAVIELHGLGIRVAMITGDSKTVAESVARRIGIDEVAAEVLVFRERTSVLKGFRPSLQWELNQPTPEHRRVAQSGRISL
jgi:magnesium-transporting ATPase (P-type)